MLYFEHLILKNLVHAIIQKFTSLPLALPHKTPIYVLFNSSQEMTPNRMSTNLSPFFFGCLKFLRKTLHPNAWPPKNGPYPPLRMTYFHPGYYSFLRLGSFNFLEDPPPFFTIVLISPPLRSTSILSWIFPNLQKIVSSFFPGLLGNPNTCSGLSGATKMQRNDEGKINI